MQQITQFVFTSIGIALVIIGIMAAIALGSFLLFATLHLITKTKRDNA